MFNKSINEVRHEYEHENAWYSRNSKHNVKIRSSMLSILKFDKSIETTIGTKRFQELNMHRFGIWNEICITLNMNETILTNSYYLFVFLIINFLGEETLREAKYSRSQIDFNTQHRQGAHTILFLFLKDFCNSLVSEKCSEPLLRIYGSR